MHAFFGCYTGVRSLQACRNAKTWCWRTELFCACRKLVYTVKKKKGLFYAFFSAPQVTLAHCRRFLIVIWRIVNYVGLPLSLDVLTSMKTGPKHWNRWADVHAGHQLPIRPVMLLPLKTKFATFSALWCWMWRSSAVYGGLLQYKGAIDVHKQMSAPTFHPRDGF